MLDVDEKCIRNAHNFIWKKRRVSLDINISIQTIYKKCLPKKKRKKECCNINLKNKMWRQYSLVRLT